MAAYRRTHQFAHRLWRKFATGRQWPSACPASFHIAAIEATHSYPVSFPVGFISAEKDVVSSVGRILKAYVEGTSGFEKPNDCGLITKSGRGE